MVQLYQTTLHTEVIKKLPRWIEAIMNTPSHHRVHHGSNPLYIDKNYAGILIIWDKMFGSTEHTLYNNRMKHYNDNGAIGFTIDAEAADMIVRAISNYFKLSQ